MDKSTIILQQGKDLKGEDLSNVYRHFNLNKELPENPAMFKKKEPLQTMAKSILKHRIQSVTDKSMTCIENEIGYVSPDGTGLTVDMLRRLAHFIILEASGELEKLPETVKPNPVAQHKILTPAKRKRKFGIEDSDNRLEQTTEREPISKKVKKNELTANDNTVAASLTPRSSRTTRKSLAPELLRKTSSPVTEESTEGIGRKSVKEQNVACRLKSHTTQKESLASTENEEDIEDSNAIESLNLGPNPTPQMIARKRRSLAVTGQNLNVTPSKNTSTKHANSCLASNGIIESTSIQKKIKPANDSYRLTKEIPSPLKRTPISTQKLTSAKHTLKETAPPLIGYPGSNNNEIFLAESHSSLKYEDIQTQVQNFNGANLTVLHTPCDWGALEVFNLVMNIRQLNRKASVTTFSVMVGCGLESLHLFHEALSRQTKHVQFIVFEREDKNLEQPVQLLRDVNSFFLLAYFFPGCENEDLSKVTIPQMVRAGCTTCFHTKSSEDLENNIVHSLSEEGDWILDLCCGGRELSLAAQKMGRNAIAVHDDPTSLTGLHEKASAIAKHHDPTFRIGTDGVILKLN